MRYLITARWWSDEFISEFSPAPIAGSNDPDKRSAERELTDAQVIDLIMRYGRASIRIDMSQPGGMKDYVEIPQGMRNIHFENDYD